MASISAHLNSDYGYSCQTWLATYIADTYFSSRYRTWFSTRLNPTDNGLSSNPLKLYEELDVIISNNDFNHSRIYQIRSSLIDWVAGSINNPLNASTIGYIIGVITHAPVRSFRPEIWKIDLGNIHVTRLRSLGQYPDEYLLATLYTHEFTKLTD